MNSFDLASAKKFASLCLLAFKTSPQQIEEGIRPLGYELFHVFDNKKSDIQGYIAEGSKSILVVFRGTDSPQDFLTNINILLTPYPHQRCPFFRPKVHAGFFQAFRSVEAEIYQKIEELKALRPSLAEIEVIGYSMGGGIGSIAAMSLKQRFQLPIKFWSFGMPRTGNRWFKRKFSKEIDESFIILNDKDIIGQVPPKGFGYRHLLTQVLLDNNQRIIINPKWFDKLESTLESAIKFLSTLSFEEHMIETYISVIDHIMRNE
ncbi:MAG: lipase family protein [Methanobacteriota archaeon]|nr:MAG: lipase family protein [Euryarchaeota archaeon]